MRFLTTTQQLLLAAAASSRVAVRDSWALIQHSLIDNRAHNEHGLDAIQLGTAKEVTLTGDKAAPPPLQDGNFNRYFGNHEAHEVQHHDHAGSTQGNSSSNPVLAKVHLLGDLVRFGSSSTSNRSMEMCHEFPKTCSPPFSCENYEASSKPPARLATEDGHSNVRSWCSYPAGYVRYAQQCASGNMFHAAQELRKVQEQRRRPDGSFPLLIMDAAYCFASGHCNDTSVTLHTTASQAEAMCDARFTRKAWTGVGATAMAASPKRRGADSAWAKVACAMGTYHCDVVYCRIYYCKDAEWKSRFGHLSQEAPPPKPVHQTSSSTLYLATMRQWSHPPPGPGPTPGPEWEHSTACRRRRRQPSAPPGQ